MFPRTMLAHGDADVWVPFEESEWARKRREEAGVEVVLKRVEGEDHGFDEGKERDKFEGLFGEVGEWLENGW